MRYFSPNILDGSVTRAKLGLLAVGSPQLGALAVGRGKLDTATGSQGGSIPAVSTVNVSLHAYSFFPDTESNQGTTHRLNPDDAAVPAANADTPVYRIQNDDVGARNYSVAWRYVDI